uniref:Uncharacterized protein n=1 Tax=Vespula pensylvanica TaxID=30213 RepID=A0A834P2F3_VESPE|nr:hypothetical protein H0235_007922 [Vespula pensylvanica]
MATTKSGLETTFIVSSSVVLWTSTSELRKFRRMPSKRRVYLWLGHEAKKRLYAEEAPTNCGSRGQLLDY